MDRYHCLQHSLSGCARFRVLAITLALLLGLVLLHLVALREGLFEGLPAH